MWHSEFECIPTFPGLLATQTLCHLGKSTRNYEGLLLLCTSYTFFFRVKALDQHFLTKLAMRHDDISGAQRASKQLLQNVAESPDDASPPAGLVTFPVTSPSCGGCPEVPRASPDRGEYTTPS